MRSGWTEMGTENHMSHKEQYEKEQEAGLLWVVSTVSQAYYQAYSVRGNNK